MMEGQRHDIDLEVLDDESVDIDLEVLDDESVDMEMEETFSQPIPVPVELEPATTTTLGGIIVGDNLSITEEGVLSVNTTTDVEPDNTRPITSAAVYTEIGNINVLLSTI